MTPEMIKTFYASGSNHGQNDVLVDMRQKFPGFKYQGNIMDFGFAAHQVEWNIMGKTEALCSVYRPRDDNQMTPELTTKSPLTMPDRLAEG